MSFYKSAKMMLPDKLKQQIFKKWTSAPLAKRIFWDAINRPYYAYGTFYAALQAQALGINKISVIEFGVAGGNGLLALEKITGLVSQDTGIEIDIYGFDTGTGMPAAVDYRDMPYVWKPGFFKMDVEALMKRLKSAKLILGDVSDTVTQFANEYNPSPIGFIAFDLDYYSSTVQAFRLLDSEERYFLPRVFCYFDDCIGDDWELHSQFTGELLAIEDFNRAHNDKKISKIHGLSYKRPIPANWNEKMFVLHNFTHPLYCQHIYPNKNWQLELD